MSAFRSSSTQAARQIQDIESDEVLGYLGTHEGGLTEREVDERRLEFGRNSLEIRDRWKTLRSLLRQFTNFFTILLNISAVICFVAHSIQPGESMDILGYALLGVSCLNALFSFIQEYRAEKAMEALKRFLPPQVKVRRGCEDIVIDAEELVPGDILQVREGDRVPADARLINVNDLLVNNAPLTGESKPISLRSGSVNRPLARSKNIVFAGCQVLRGSGSAVVFATGLRTEFGKIAHLSQAMKRTRSPLEVETSRMVRILTTIAVAMGFIFFMYGVFTGRSLWVNLVFMMGIIVANVPEGLLPTFTLSLALGAVRMAKKNVLVKTLSAVESLGAVHTICTDKTGTLTLNQLKITHIANASDGGKVSDENDRREILRLAMIASQVDVVEGRLSGDPLDVAVAEELEANGNKIDDLLAKRKRFFAFDVERKSSAGLYDNASDTTYAIKGAWEALRNQVVEVKGSDKVDLNHIDSVVHKLASSGLRVIAVASRRGAQSNGNNEGKWREQLTLHGFVGISDPVRPEVAGATEQCHAAGIDVILITGDHPDTARAVARECGIVPASMERATVITGDQLEDMKQAELVAALEKGVQIFARTTPEQKMKIVSALKSMGRVTAMTGDGVNDAPALRAADVGVAMGMQGTDVARESAQIVLLDDNFASIVAGIEQGRTVFNNIKKFTNYVLVSNGPEILPYLIYILLPVPLAMTVIQILSIDLGTDIIPSMALGQEPPEPDIMERPPRREGLLTLPVISHSYLFLGLCEGAWSLFLFFYVLVDGGWQYGQDLASNNHLYQSATGIALSTILLMQIGNLIGRRYRFRSGLDFGLFRNKLLMAGIIIQIVFSWATLYFPPMNKILGTQPVDQRFYILAWLGIPLIFGLDYIRKKVWAVVQKRRIQGA